MKKQRLLVGYILFVGLGIALCWLLYSDTNPFAAIHLPLERTEIEQRSFELAEQLGLETEGYFVYVRLHRNVALIRQLQTEQGIGESNRLLRGGVHGYYWNVRWIRSRDTGWGVFRPQEIEDGLPAPLTEKRWDISTDGKLLRFELGEPDSASLRTISQEDAFRIARDFLETYGADSALLTENTGKKAEAPPEPQVQSIQHDAFNEYLFTWETDQPELNHQLRTEVRVLGGNIAALKTEYVVPPKYDAESQSPLTQTFAAVMQALIAVITIVIAFRRWRAYEISFQFAVRLGIFVGILFLVFLYQNLPPNMGWQIVIPLVFGTIFVGGTIIFLWAVAESIGRETWSGKFTSMDLLRNGYFSHSQIGQDIFLGIGFGALVLVVESVLIMLVSQVSPLTYIVQNHNYLRYIDTLSPLAYFISLFGFTGFFTVAAFFVLAVSILRRWFESPLLLLTIPAVLFSLAFQGNVQPFWQGILTEVPGTILMIWVFYRYNVFSALITFFTVNTMQVGLSLFTMGHPHYLGAGYSVAAFFLLLLIYGGWCLLCADRISDFQRLAPVYVKNITERQRLQRELEIAREVQMSFLPDSNPQMTELDIASRCEPALEVGGDYYDFIDLGDGRLGVAIGDVSGKGTQAAFYMTLTKGFLRALANMSDSPATVLNQLNRLFYDNVKRGVFISMIYGIFDTRAGLLTLARAGHNPVVMRKTRARHSEVINPRGIALGMEKGNVFEQTIQEVTTRYQPGDLFVFYTDGFTEAMNKQNEEFGEERFEAAIEEHADKSAERVMEAIFEKVRQFTGRTPQHDDMTIVVVKVRQGGNGKTILAEALEAIESSDS